MTDDQYSDYRALVRNLGDREANLSFTLGEKYLGREVIKSDSSKFVDLGCPEPGLNELKVQGQGVDIKKEIGLLEGYCIKIENTSIEYEGLKSYKVWEARAFLNDNQKTAYSNKDVEIKIDNKTKILTTNSSGEFRFRERWDVPYVESGAMWQYQETYNAPTDIQDFHTSRGRFQPPNRIGLTYADGTQKFQQTQQAMEGEDSNNIDLTYNIEPVQVSSENITLRAKFNIEAKSGMEDDWNNNNGRMLYQIPLKDGTGSHASISDLECTASSDVDCNVGDLNVQISSDIGNQELDSSTLPEESGEKYIPRDIQVEASGQPYIGGLDRYQSAKYSGNYVRVSHNKDMIYVPQGKSLTLYDNNTLNSISNHLQNTYNDPSADAKTEYKSRLGLVPSALGWWNGPSIVSNVEYYSVDTTLTDTSSTSSTASQKTVLYEWNDVNSGETYNLEFEVTLDRDSSDKNFILPIHQGTFGMFPDDGGTPVSNGERYNVYTDGMIRYPRFRNTGRYSFRITVPKQGSSNALVYKTTVPGDGGNWTANTYVMNTAQENIEEIYLLNSRGQWVDMEDQGAYFPDPGNSYSDGFNLQDNSGEITQVNLQFQTIDGSYSSPTYDDWPYTFNLQIQGDSTTYNEDISDEINCRPRYCLSYRIGNREEARPIDQLRSYTGSAASRSTWGESENLERIDFTISNSAGSNSVEQRLKFLKFWIWYLQPTTADLENQLVRPEKLRIETLETSENQRAGLYVEEFDN
jgi:hypothetical protein